MLRRYLAISLALAFAAFGQSYNGPRPPTTDSPYIRHAGNLIPTEEKIAKDETKRDTITHIIEGAASPAITPLASPVFLLQAEKLAPEDLQLFRLEVKKGRREAVETKKKPLRPIRLDFTRLTTDKLWQIEVDESLEPGEYALTPNGSDKVFCFQVR